MPLLTYYIKIFNSNIFLQGLEIFKISVSLLKFFWRQRGYWRLSGPGSQHPVAQPIAPAQVICSSSSSIALLLTLPIQGPWIPGASLLKPWVSVPSS